MQHVHHVFDGDVALAALSAYSTIKSVTVVNTDIDVYNAEELIWAVVTRADLKDDVTLLPHLLGHPLDPSSVEGLVTKSVIDATQLAGKASFDRVVYEDPGDLGKYLP